MKKIIATFIALLYIHLLAAQQVDKSFPTKFAIVLYAQQVTDTSGNNKLLAAHFQHKGGGTFTWEKNIAEAGLYDIAVCYASRASGIKAALFTQENKVISGVLESTSGYYKGGLSGYSFNSERKQLPGMLNLLKGKNTITLELTTATPADELVLYSVELVPVSKQAAADKDRAKAQNARPKAAWFSNAGYGVMFHWTSQSMPQQGTKKDYQQAVDDFDVSAFASMVEKTGAAYIIFTTNHAEPYFPAPLTTWEKEYPEHTTKRDLISEIADSLEKRKIKLILYMASHIYAKYESKNEQEFSRLNNTFLKEIGERYKKKVAGYWFDGWYQCYENFPSFDFEQFYGICKTGNKDRLIALNSWLYPVNTMWQDYYPGELFVISSPASSRILQNGPGKGLQGQSLIVMEQNDWLHQKQNASIPSPNLEPVTLSDFIIQSMGKAPVTINMQIYQDGRVGNEALAVMEQVKKRVRGNK